MYDVLTITGPIFLLIGLGYAAVYVGVFEPAQMRVLGRFVLMLCLPALFDALSRVLQPSAPAPATTWL